VYQAFCISVWSVARYAGRVASVVFSLFVRALLRHILIVRLIPRHSLLRKDAFLPGDQLRKHSACKMCGIVDLCVQVVIAEFLIELRRPFGGANRKDQASGYQERRPELRPVGPFVVAANFRRHGGLPISRIDRRVSLGRSPREGIADARHTTGRCG